MESREQDALVQRLVANPHDGEALTYAYQWGTSDPQAFALLLEKVGTNTQDAVYASHWLSEAANVWLVSVGDAHRAARVLMTAIDRDPTQEAAAERLAALYRERGEHRSLAALLERRSRALTRLTGVRPELRTTLAATYTELGQIWADTLTQPRRAMEFFRQAIEAEPRAHYAIFALRELYKQQQAYAEAVALYEPEHALVDDPARKLALFRDEAALRREAGDGAGATQVLRNARAFEPSDPTLLHEIASLVLERAQAGEPVPEAERQEAAAMLVSLAEGYGGEHGYAYSAAALTLEPGNDRAVQLATFFGKGVGFLDELPSLWGAYLGANPEGLMAEEVRSELAMMPTGPVPDVPPPGRLSRPRESASTRAHDVASARGEASAARQLVSSSRSADPGLPADAPTPPSSALAAPQAHAAEPEPAPNSAPTPVPIDVEALVREGDEALARGGRAVAFGKYKEALGGQPAHPKALAGVRDYLRQKRRYDELRDVLAAAASEAEVAEPERGKEILRELAALSEQQLRDVEGAINALERLIALDRRDAAAGESLRRLLERAGRWDDLARWLEGEADAAEGDAKLALLRRLAQLHEARRKDDVAAAGVWLRAAGLGAGDGHALRTAMRLYERAGRLDAADGALGEAVDRSPPGPARAALFAQLAEVRRKAGDAVGAAFALRASAELTGDSAGWEGAERALAEAGRWLDAAETLEARARNARDERAQALLYVRASELYERAGELELAGDRLRQAFELDPSDPNVSEAYEGLLAREGRWAELAPALLAQAEHSSDAARRRALYKRAARVQRERLDDPASARETLRRALEGGDDEEALGLLADDAEARGEYQEAALLVRRLLQLPLEAPARLALTRREARLLAGPLADQAGALERYRAIATELAPHDVEALRFVADADEASGRSAQAAESLERLVAALLGEEREEAARRLASLYEGPLADPAAALRTLDVLAEGRERDPLLLDRLAVLSERVGDFGRVAELLPRRIELEVDPRAISALSRRLAAVLDARLNAGDEALATLEGPADEGDEACQRAYVELGDRLGWKGLVGVKLVAWHESRGHSPERSEALLGAFRRFSEIGRDADALRVGLELVRSKAADAAFVRRLEEIALRLPDHEALTDLHEWLARGRSGFARAEELVRQAEARARAGVDPPLALAHGEVGLSGMPFDEAEPLLLRLAALVPPAEAPDTFERYVERAPSRNDRARAFVRAARFSLNHAMPQRASALFERAIVSGGPSLGDDTLAPLEQGARAGGPDLVAAFAQALARAGHAFVDGGRTRAALLRRAAQLAHHDLNDLDQAFTWLVDGVVSHSEPAALEALEALARHTGDYARLDKAYGRALGSVFDGHVVRSLLDRRARVRREHLGDRAGALEDLRKLYELSPSDVGVVEQLKSLLAEMGDERGTLRLLEDQIVRTRDSALRVELAKNVARLWEARGDEPREAADAWRRVLRFQPNETEAQEGLARTKAAMANAGIEHEPSAPPPLPAPSQRGSSLPPPPADRRAPAAPRTRSIAPPPLPPTSSLAPPATSSPAAPSTPSSASSRALPASSSLSPPTAPPSPSTSAPSASALSASSSASPSAASLPAATPAPRPPPPDLLPTVDMSSTVAPATIAPNTEPMRPPGTSAAVSLTRDTGGGFFDVSTGTTGIDFLPPPGVEDDDAPATKLERFDFEAIEAQAEAHARAAEAAVKAASAKAAKGKSSKSGKAEKSGKASKSIPVGEAAPESIPPVSAEQSGASGQAEKEPPSVSTSAPPKGAPSKAPPAQPAFPDVPNLADSGELFGDKTELQSMPYDPEWGKRR
ncbi:MAG: hypothetical protein MUF34_07735 [Polyangiaceae bacterium]|nr:hypothetical protein [Polyangiaceae bacterium]